MNKWVPIVSFFIVLSFGFYLINFQVHASTPQSNVSSDYINSLSLQRSFPIKEDRAIIILDKKVQEPDIKEILNNHPGLEIGFIYEEVFHGFSVTGPPEAIAQLKKTYASEKIFPSYQYKIADTKPTHLSSPNKLYPLQDQMNSSIDLIGTKQIRHFQDENGNRLTGRGMVVGIIDTGVDYEHPDLRGNYLKGYDFVDMDDDPMETKRQGPLDTIHGTHVTGVIVANGNMQGIAPEAKFIAYRALGPGGTGTTEQILAAIEHAIKDKVDVLNLSIGININGPDLPISLALDMAVKKGIIAVTSNGNAGPELWTVGSPGTSYQAISVGASTPELDYPYLQINEKEFRLTPFIGSRAWPQNCSFHIIDGRKGRKNELEELDITGKIVLIKRSDAEISEVIDHAIEKGARGIIIYNNEEGDFTGGLGKEVPVPVASLPSGAGAALKNELKKGSQWVRIITKKVADELASFSSRGPVTFTWNIKPDVVAPGVSIMSTAPSGYVALQGTSMASPHVAGACLLLKQAHPDWSPQQIKAALMNTGKFLKKDDNESYETFEQGAGRIQLDQALTTNTLVLPSSLVFGRTRGEKFTKIKRTLQVENVSVNRVRYTFLPPARTDDIVWDFPAPFYLEPGQKKEITVTIEVKEKHRKNKIYNGLLQLQAGSQLIHIPYLYVVDEPDYPRIMGFSFMEGAEKGTYKYEVYLPGGADELGIVLYDPETYRFIGTLVQEKNVKRGLVSKEIQKQRNIPDGIYKAVAFAKKGDRTDYLEQIIELAE